MNKVRVSVDERLVLLTDLRPTRWLGPGAHTLRPWWAVFFPGPQLSTVKVPTTSSTADIRPELAALAPKDELSELVLAPNERAFVWTGGRAVAYLGAGRHFVWTIDKSTKVERVTTDAPLATPLDRMRRALVSKDDYAEVTVPESGIGLRFEDGKIAAELPPGRYAAWKTSVDVAFVVLDRRSQVQSIAAQEILTRDRVTLRLNLSLVFAVHDARRVSEVATDAKDILYVAAQLAAREAVAARTLDELLDDRDALSKELLDKVRPRAEALGLRLDELGVKDVILPGDMRELLNKVIEAKKRAEANVILRREEAAATRSLAQTAKVMEEQPFVARLKELEAYKEIAAEIGHVSVVLGDGGLPKLELKVCEAGAAATK